MAGVHLVVLLAATVITGRTAEERATVDGAVTRMQRGLDTAGRLLGVDTARGVAHLVSSSLLNSRPLWTRHAAAHGGGGIFGGFLRLLGVDSTKLGAIALNAMVFIAQLISNSLTTPVHTKEGHPQGRTNGSPLSWILDSPDDKTRRLLQTAQEHTLPQMLAGRMPSRHLTCVQLLICKTAPFIWGMQRSLRSLLQPDPEVSRLWRSLSPLQRFYVFLPGAAEVADHGDHCQGEYPECQQLSLGSPDMQ